MMIKFFVPVCRDGPYVKVVGIYNQSYVINTINQEILGMYSFISFGCIFELILLLLDYPAFNVHNFGAKVFSYSVYLRSKAKFYHLEFQKQSCKEMIETMEEIKIFPKELNHQILEFVDRKALLFSKKWKQTLNILFSSLIIYYWSNLLSYVGKNVVLYNNTL